MGPRKEAYDEFMAAASAYQSEKLKTDPTHEPSRRLRRKAHRLWAEAMEEKQTTAAAEAARESGEAQAGLLRQGDA